MMNVGTLWWDNSRRDWLWKGYIFAKPKEMMKILNDYVIGQRRAKNIISCSL